MRDIILKASRWFEVAVRSAAAFIGVVTTILGLMLVVGVVAGVGLTPAHVLRAGIFYTTGDAVGVLGLGALMAGAGGAFTYYVGESAGAAAWWRKQLPHDKVIVVSTVLMVVPLFMAPAMEKFLHLVPWAYVYGFAVSGTAGMLLFVVGWAMDKRYKKAHRPCR